MELQGDLLMNEINSNEKIIQKKPRNVSLDITRCLAILLVILNHAVESYYNLEEYDHAIAIDSFERSGIMFLFTLGRLGVPLFLFITGYLLLHRDYDSPGSIRHFWIHNLLSIIVTWEIWLVLYNIFLAYMNQTAFDVNMWIRQALFVDKIEITHYWYVPMIIGVYFFIPFIAKGIKNVAKPYLYIILAVCIVTLFVVPSINTFYSAFEMDLLSLKATPVFIATFPVTFIFMGHLFYLNRNSGRMPVAVRIIIDSAVFTASLIVSVYLQIFLHQNGSQYNIWYSFFTLPPMAYALFDLLNMIPLKRIYLIRRISICSFGIYLIHRPVQMLFEQKVPLFSHTDGTQLFIGTMWLLFLVSFVISYLLTEGLAAIPIAGELLVRVRKKKIRIF